MRIYKLGSWDYINKDENARACKTFYTTCKKKNQEFAIKQGKKIKRGTTSVCASCHLEPLSNLRTLFFFFFALVHVIFLRSVPARGRVTDVHVLSPGYRARARVHACTCGAAAHPCLLSSSGSCPVELERRAQRRSASEEFILRGGKHKQRFQHPRTVSLSDRSEDTICRRSHKNTGQKQDTGAIFHKGIV